MTSVTICSGEGQRKRISIHMLVDDASEYRAFTPVPGWIAVARHVPGSGIVFISWHRDTTTECDPVDIIWHEERFKFGQWASAIMGDEAEVLDTGVHGEALPL